MIEFGLLTDGVFHAGRIARIYNVCAHEYAQEGIEEWTKKTHPSIWQDLEKVARTQTEEGLRLEEFEDDLSSML